MVEEKNLSGWKLVHKALEARAGEDASLLFGAGVRSNTVQGQVLDNLGRNFVSLVTETALPFIKLEPGDTQRIKETYTSSICGHLDQMSKSTK